MNRTRVKNFFKFNKVMTVAATAAVITSFFVPPDKTYFTYFDFKTLTCLFCVLAVVCALSDIYFFYILAQKIVRIFGNLKICVLALVYITFIGSMLIANDMALLTFLPLGYIVLKETENEKYMAFTFIMQNIAANLGGMVTPFGNPQNLYLYTKFNIPTGEFTLIMLPPFLISIVLITVCCLVFVKGKPAVIKKQTVRLNKPRAVIYLLLFALSIVIVFRVIPYWIGLIVIPVSLFFLDKNALKRVDYGLLLTFVSFFIFSGNLSRIDVIRDFLSELLSRSTLLVGVASCQIISNVPTAILLSQFTSNYRDLLLAVNIGGVGTLIASLASLITLREFIAKYPDKTKKYIVLFSAFNFSFLIILVLFCAFFPVG